MQPAQGFPARGRSCRRWRGALCIGHTDPRGPRRISMANDLMEPRTITPPSGLAPTPNWNWNRALQAPGHMGVDYETRVDFRRLHDYRLARARAALKASKCGALLLFDV